MAMNDMEPQELQLALQGVAAQDRDAYSKIYSHYWDQIYRFSRNQFPDSATAEDVAEDVFFDLLCKPIGFNNQAKFSSYLCKIARNKVVDLIRKKKSADKYPQVNIDDEAECPDIPDDSRSSNPEHALEDRQDDAQFRKCLDKLPDAQKEAISMRCYELLTEAEIASEVGCAIGTVKSRLSTARASLKKCLEPWRREVVRA